MTTVQAATLPGAKRSGPDRPAGGTVSPPPHVARRRVAPPQPSLLPRGARHAKEGRVRGPDSRRDHRHGGDLGGRIGCRVQMDALLRRPFRCRTDRAFRCRGDEHALAAGPLLRSRPHGPQKGCKRADRFAQFAIAASREAVAQSALQGGDVDPTRVGVLIGSGIGGIETFEAQHQNLLEKGPGRVSPFFVPMLISDMASGLVSMQFGFKGPNFCAVSACASAANAIGSAYLLIKAGQADAIVSGGSEATVTPMTIAGFCSMKAMSERNDDTRDRQSTVRCRSDGFVMGERRGDRGDRELEHAAVARRRSSARWPASA